MEYISQYGFIILVLAVIIVFWVMMVKNPELRRKYFQWHFSSRKTWMIVFVVFVLIVVLWSLFKTF